MTEPRFSSLMLRFANPGVEAAFRQDYAESLVLVRWALLLGVVQYAGYGLLDRWMVPVATEEVRVIRVVVCIVLSLGLFATFAPWFRRGMQTILGVLIFVGGCGIVAMAWVAREGVLYHHYYAGLMLVLIYVHVLLRLRFVTATAVGTALLVIYLVVVDAAGIPAPMLWNNAFFLVATQCCGMAASYALEYYARRVFWQTRALREKQSLLEAEDRRKSQELEEARQLQLRLLPQTLPERPNVALAASMRAATEIGGDYYDVVEGGDGTITLVIGDATGHGAQAGVMVTATKALFTCRTGEEEDLAASLRAMSRALRHVGHGRLFMALALARLRGAELELVGAGMPPALIHRAATGGVDSVPLKGLPLGGADFPYHTTVVTLAPGDTVVLMSDGFPELFDAEGRMLGYEAVEGVFAEVVGGSPSEVIAGFERHAQVWRGAHPLRDDVTFLVCQLKPELEPVGGEPDAGTQRSTPVPVTACSSRLHTPFGIRTGRMA